MSSVLRKWLRAPFASVWCVGESSCSSQFISKMDKGNLVLLWEAGMDGPSPVSRKFL